MSGQEVSGESGARDRGELGQCPWKRDPRAVGHCVSGLRLSPGKQEGPRSRSRDTAYPRGSSECTAGPLGGSPDLSESPIHEDAE